MRAAASENGDCPFSQVCSGIGQDIWGNGHLSVGSRQMGMSSAGGGRDIFTLEKCLGVC